MQKIQGKLFQAGYDHGLDATLIPSTSSLWTPVFIPPDFKCASEKEKGEVEEKDEK